MTIFHFHKFTSCITQYPGCTRGCRVTSITRVTGFLIQFMNSTYVLFKLNIEVTTVVTQMTSDKNWPCSKLNNWILMFDLIMDFNIICVLSSEVATITFNIICSMTLNDRILMNLRIFMQ